MLPNRGLWRRLCLGLPTLLGTARRGFFIPHRHADATVAPMRYPAIETLFRDAEPAFLEALAAIEGVSSDLETIAPSAPAPAARWLQGWFARLDAAAAYAFVRDWRPARIVEVGSGHSTRFLARAVADGGLDTRILAIDPAPRAPLAGLAVEHKAATLQAVGTAPFTELGPGDILFVDSSHVAMPGTDVDLIANQVLPFLPAGVRVHIHDMLLPDDYPESWRWRAYNEQIVIAAIIAAGGYRPLFASHYVVTRMSAALSSTIIGRLPHLDSTPETSLWLEKLSGDPGSAAP